VARRGVRSRPNFIMTYDCANPARLDETSGRKDVREHAAGRNIFPSIAARNIKGYRGAELFIREDDDEMEFVTLLRFDSLDAVKKFAGSDETRPVIFRDVEKLLTRMEPARHYRVAI